MAHAPARSARLSFAVTSIRRFLHTSKPPPAGTSLGPHYPLPQHPAHFQGRGLVKKVDSHRRFRPSKRLGLSTTEKAERQDNVRCAFRDHLRVESGFEHHLIILASSADSACVLRPLLISLCSLAALPLPPADTSCGWWYACISPPSCSSCSPMALIAARAIVSTPAFDPVSGKPPSSCHTDLFSR